MITLLLGIVIGVVVSLVGAQILSNPPEDAFESNPHIKRHERELSRLVAEMKLSKRDTTEIAGQRVFWLLSTQGRYLSEVIHNVELEEGGQPEVSVGSFTASNVEVTKVADSELLKLIKNREVTALENKELISAISAQLPQLKLHEVVVNEKTDITITDYR